MKYHIKLIAIIPSFEIMVYFLAYIYFQIKKKIIILKLQYIVFSTQKVAKTMNG